MENNQREGTAVREVTRGVYGALLLDCWPGPAGCREFGLVTQAHYSALHYAVRVAGVTPEQLERARGNGEALTALIGPGNPFRGVVFRTDGDKLRELKPGVGGAGSEADDVAWGFCPTCRLNDGYLNLGREHWFKCDTHRVKWAVGENLFSSWRAESEADWEENRRVLGDYRQVNPFSGGPDDEEF